MNAKNTTYDHACPSINATNAKHDIYGLVSNKYLNSLPYVHSLLLSAGLQVTTLCSPAMPCMMTGRPSLITCIARCAMHAGHVLIMYCLRKSIVRNGGARGALVVIAVH
jgi:hypothetical protein